MRILILNGPNLNLLGTRSPELYGTADLESILARCAQHVNRLGDQFGAFQSNSEGDLIDAIHGASGDYDGIVFNPGAYTHYSYALHDAIEAAGLPTVEIHISNIRRREAWRRVSVTAPACAYQIFGRGVDGYLHAISHLHYRATKPPITLAYGPHTDQIGDLRLPENPGPHPVAVLIHGGGWADQYTRDLMDGAAVDLTARGWATWNIEYRRIPPYGGWKDAMSDTTAALDYVRTLTDRFALDLNRVVVVGHSAGAQLGFFAAKNSSIRALRLVLLAGMLDLRQLPADFDPLIDAFMGDDRRRHLEEADPIRSLPIGVEMVVGHGLADPTVPISQSQHFAEAAIAASDRCRLAELLHTDHMDIVSPLSNTWEQTAGILDDQ